MSSSDRARGPGRPADLVEHILDALPQPIFWKDRRSVYLGCNRAFADAVGLSHPDLIAGKTDHDLPWPRAEADAYRADDDEVMSTGRPKQLIHEQLQQADGSRIQIETSKAPLFDAGGVVWGVLGIYTDVTERRRQDRAGRYLGCNRLFAADAGIESPEAVVGRLDADLGWHEQSDLYRADDEAVMASEAPKPGYEEPQTTPDGGCIWLRTSKTPLRDANGGVIGVLGTYLTMPNVDGEETFLALRRTAPGVRVILTSGYNEMEATSRFVGRGLAGSLQKPFALEELEAKIAEILA